MKNLSTIECPTEILIGLHLDIEESSNQIIMIVYSNTTLGLIGSFLEDARFPRILEREFWNLGREIPIQRSSTALNTTSIFTKDYKRWWSYSTL